MRYLRYIFVAIYMLLIFSGAAGADSKAVGTIRDKEASWYAVVKTADGKMKLCAKGDIFYSSSNPDRCFRIDEIEKDALILKESGSKNSLTLKPGEKVPIEDELIVFEKTIEADVIEYRYNVSEDAKREYVEDFTIRDLEEEMVVLEKDALLDALSEEGREVFEAPQTEVKTETIKAGLFEDIKIEKVKDDVWSVDRESTETAFSNAGKALVSVIKSAEPRFRFGEGPSLKFNCELGGVVLSRDGFLVQNLAVASIAERAGIIKGDLIQSVNGQPVNSLYGIFRAYMDVKANKDIKVVSVNIIRDGKPRMLIYNMR